jgi:type III secretion protein R
MKGADLAAWATLLVAVPFVVVVATSYIKFAVVLAILRRALGGSALPPATVTGALALLFALFVTAPVGERVWAAASPGLSRGDAASLGEAAQRATGPVRDFLASHTPARERQSFFELQQRLRPADARSAVTDHDLVVLAPAFAAAELRAAFQVGFLLFLPFLVIELVVATVLLALGMNTLSPEAVSLPFKLLLFVVADGWHLILRGLVLGYT